MSARPARWEIVRTAAKQPWHARFRASNGRVLFTSENYHERRAALRAIELVAGVEVYESPFQEWPEIAHAGDLIEIRDVDERGVS